jgi:anti-anti-sigma regulatory factor
VDFEGRFFFGAEGTLRRHINTLLEDEGAKAFVFHMAGTHGMDVSIAECLANIAEKARLRGRLFFFTGVSAETFQMWERLGLLGTFGEDNVVVGRIPWEKCSDEVLYRLWESLGGGPCPSCGEACACKAPGSRPHIADVISLNQRS